tara:strand:+ start:652 stop:888 length:237 start_codon:yes stop_codon:yes gene_type:complete
MVDKERPSKDRAEHDHSPLFTEAQDASRNNEEGYLVDGKTNNYESCVLVDREGCDQFESPSCSDTEADERELSGAWVL